MFKYSYFKKIKVNFVSLKKQSAKNNSLKSFVLIELLVAISIFAVVMTVVYTTLYTSIKAYHRAQRELRFNQEINLMLDKLSLDLRNCYDAEYNEEENSGGFIGNSQSISFFTIQNVYTQGEFKKLLARITYNFRDGKLFKKLQLDKNAFLDEGNFQEEELISDIEELNFEYLYFKKELPEESYEYEWKSEWADKTLIPKGVNIEVTRRDPDADISLTLKRNILLMQGEIGVQE